MVGTAAERSSQEPDAHKKELEHLCFVLPYCVLCVCCCYRQAAAGLMLLHKTPKQQTETKSNQQQQGGALSGTTGAHGSRQRQQVKGD